MLSYKMELSELDFILINVVSFSSGIFLGLTICCRNKEVFLQRVASKEKLPEPSIIQCDAVPKNDLSVIIR